MITDPDYPNHWWPLDNPRGIIVFATIVVCENLNFLDRVQHEWLVKSLPGSMGYILLHL